MNLKHYFYCTNYIVETKNLRLSFSFNTSHTITKSKTNRKRKSEVKKCVHKPCLTINKLTVKYKLFQITITNYALSLNTRPKRACVRLLSNWRGTLASCDNVGVYEYGGRIITLFAKNTHLSAGIAADDLVPLIVLYYFDLSNNISAWIKAFELVNQLE